MKSFTKYIALAFAIITFASCERYSTPEPNFPEYSLSDFGGERITIAELKNRHTISYPAVIPSQIKDNIILQGVIVGDDNSGNIYKSLYIQDETGAINLAINQVNLYNIMPVGQIVYIKLKGLYIGDYGGTHQIGFIQPDNRMGRWDWAWEMYRDHTTGEYPHKHFYPSGIPSADNLPEAKVITSANEISDDDICTLVTLENVYFNPEDAGSLTWSEKEETVNRTLYFNDSTEIIVRTSGYSNFYADLLPMGRGNLTCIMSKFADDYQIYVRGREDIDFQNQ